MRQKREKDGDGEKRRKQQPPSSQKILTNAKGYAILTLKTASSAAPPHPGSSSKETKREPCETPESNRMGTHPPQGRWCVPIAFFGGAPCLFPPNLQNERSRTHETRDLFQKNQDQKRSWRSDSNAPQGRPKRAHRIRFVSRHLRHQRRLRGAVWHTKRLYSVENRPKRSRQSYLCL